MHGEVTVVDALKLIEHRTVKDRNEGFANLRNILRRNKKSNALKDGLVHYIYEALFQVAIDDRATYLKASTPTTRSAAENRLSACASALRGVVEDTVHFIRLKTLRAVLDHVIELFARQNGSPCEPLALEYAKCLTALLGYQPHVEHLKPEERERCVLFCVEAVKTAISSSMDAETEPGAEMTSTAGTIHGQSYRSSRSHYKDSVGSQGGRSLSKQIAEEMIGCLSILTAAPNAAMGAQHALILDAVVDFLQTGTATMKSQQDAFAVVNHVLSVITTQDVGLTKGRLTKLIRLLRIYWSPRTTADALKDEMIVAHLYLHPYVSSAMRTRENLTLRSELSSALKVMRNEYANRQQRHQLRMEDISLCVKEERTDFLASMEIGVCSLRCSGPRVEANWATLHTMASLSKLLTHEVHEDGSPIMEEEEDEEPDSRPRKRQRFTSELDELVDTSSSGKILSRTAALQTLVFLAQQVPCSSRQMAPILDKLSSSCADDNMEISSWALLALASFAMQHIAMHAALSSRWNTIWQLAARAMINASTCRPACHLLYIMSRLRLVSVQIVGDLVQTMTASMDLNGPTVLADSVTKLFAHMIRFSQQTNPTSSVGAAESILSWLFRTFTPSQFVNRDYAGQAIFESADVVELIASCLNKPLSTLHKTAAQYPSWGYVGQCWLRVNTQAELVGYLLLLPSPADDPVQRHLSSNGLPGPTTHSRPSCETIALTNLISESVRMQEAWAQSTLKSVSSDMFSLFCKACHVTSSIAFCSTLRDARRQGQLQKQAQGLLQSLLTFAKTSMCPQDKIDAMLLVFSRAFGSLQEREPAHPPCQCEILLCKYVCEILGGRNDVLEPSGQGELDDLMDMDDEFDSQDSRRTDRTSEVQVLQSDNAVAFGNLALRANILIYTTLRTKMEDSRRKSQAVDAASAEVLDAVFALPDPMVFAGRDIISRLPQLGLDLTVEDASRLAEFCVERLGAYQFERCEVALGAILDIMASITSFWTDPANGQIYDDGRDMYNWYITVGFPNAALSPNVQCRLASLLLQLCHVDLDYGKNDSCPSARTSIFELISKGSIAVQYHLASRISTIFGLFVLSTHPIMFEDLRETLPKDTSNVEGIAIRLLFFSRLASAWHSLLRECVFYIVETAGQSKSASRLATHCIADLAKALHFESSHKLFRLFASQLLHSWLEGQSVNDLPFSVFQYDSLDALVTENMSEITAQLFVRGKEERFEVVTSALKTSKIELLKLCLAKLEAYCISYDISKTSAETESRLRTALGGKEELNRLILTQYPAILAQFFLSAQNEDVEDKWLEKRAGYSEEAKALKEIKSYSYSNRALPVCQQPSFKSKWLCDQIERLGRRVGKADAVQRWDASTYAFAARALLDSIDSALGPLHTCLVIRRLRLLICLAGDVAVTDYQLEMLISALRPFLNDSQCADDAMGVLQYLFRRGHPYLMTQLPFVCGTVALMTLQIRKHSGARQESTTQESQHKATVDRMRAFHTWLINYLKSCQPSNASISSKYSALAQSLAEAHLPGNSRRATPESTLLLMLLRDGEEDNVMFRAVDRDEALVMLSDRFEAPHSVDEDCLSVDIDCVSLVQQLWRVSRLPDLGRPLLGWAASAIGRAYAASGQRPLVGERSIALAPSPAYEGIATSQAAIAKRLVEALYSGGKQEASTADSTLRKALQSFDDNEDGLIFESMLPSSLVPALHQAEQGYSPVLNPTFSTPSIETVTQLYKPSSQSSLDSWVQQLSVALCHSAKRVPLLPPLVEALRTQSFLALDLFPMIVHILLATELGKDLVLRTELSASVTAHLSEQDPGLIPKQAYLLKLLLYLRAQMLPGEHTEADRLLWLEVDWLQAADAAVRCKMPQTALLFAESATTASSGNRRSSSRASMSPVTIAQVSQQLLLSIFKAVDEPDSFYGVEQPASLDSVLDRLDFEADGYRSLMFRSAQVDTHALRSHNLSADDSAGMVRSLSMLNLSSLTFALLLSGGGHARNSSSELFNSARKLQQWDIAAPEASRQPISSSFTILQELSRANDRSTIIDRLDSILLDHMEQIDLVTAPNREWFGALASIVEMQEAVGCSSQSAIRAEWERMQSRQDWMHLSRFDDVSLILSNRQILFSTLARNEGLLKDMRGGLKDCRAIEIEALLNVAYFAREHDQLQVALTAVNQAEDLVGACEDIGLKVDAAVKLGTAAVLWDSQEATASVKMMQDTLDLPSIDKQDIDSLGQAGLLARLAHQLGGARLERPETILANYLEPAIQHLRGRSDGEEAGEVFHEFATFCDKQLQNPGSNEDFERIARLRQKKLEELNELERLMKTARRREQQDSYQNDHRKAKKWFEIDNADYQRLKSSRDIFMQQSLQNYMLTLRATNKHNISVLRLFALWLENADVAEANHVASKYLSGIPSWKFVLLMNQLMSRLENDGSTFQKALSSLLLRVCSDHPHHSLHHLFASTRKPASGEPVAVSRCKAASTIRQQLSSDSEKRVFLERTFMADKMYNALANEDAKHLPSRASIKDLSSTEQMRRNIPAMQIPPITINVQLRPNGDYSNVPVITRFGSSMRLMSGLSRPKAITVHASDGKQYQQLFKSGNDDLRQDAIMEQVFEEVSKMLRNHKTTRQRNLVVRTYKVIPLGPNCGAIEFVPNSISFGEFLKPAHERYHPQDYKDSKARSIVHGAKDHSTEVRIKEFRKVCEHLHPVMRHFFFERFNEPDEWFQKRTAYTRTTATISILGYVLGLGDRHCQNIMLDEKTGEVVHIDLGVAFEAGRVLPIPELVPFRLSRDVVDGMGITKTEGVFRRCCEFTMDALREDKDSIMTLLNVLRYDPLYTWSVSPLRAKRMQEETGREAGAGGASKRKESEAGEGERALSIVEKKLSKTLSTAATVNELIQQATNERNLATLFSGWAAWF